MCLRVSLCIDRTKNKYQTMRFLVSLFLVALLCASAINHCVDASSNRRGNVVSTFKRQLHGGESKNGDTVGLEPQLTQEYIYDRELSDDERMHLQDSVELIVHDYARVSSDLQGEELEQRTREIMDHLTDLGKTDVEKKIRSVLKMEVICKIAAAKEGEEGHEH